MREVDIIQEVGAIHCAPTYSHCRSQLWHYVALAAILLFSTFLNIFRLEQNGYGNLYYAAAIKSMLQSWHNFYYVSFDPGGFVSVDKPPLGFWIQAVSAKLFGFSSWSLLLPQAIAGILSVALLYHLVRRIFGPVAGLIAALTLAVTPISVVTSRDNTVDSLLVLAVLLAAWTVSIASETGRLRWLLLTAFIIGLGFNIKMLEAYLVLPAFGLIYLLGAPRRWRTRILHLFLATIVLLVVSLSWTISVDLTPVNQRPYVGSSSSNSERELAFGYNGLERLIGLHPATTGNTSNTRSDESPLVPSPTGVLGGSETGSPGPFRLLNTQLGGQISWLLPLALIGLLVTAWQTWRNDFLLPLERRQQALALWGTWLVTMATFFSIAGFFHVYYMVMLAPAIAALVGTGLVTLWQEYQRSDWRGWLLPFALIITAIVQVRILWDFPKQGIWLIPLVNTLCLLVALLLLLARLWPHLRLNKPHYQYALITIGMLALLIGPTVWASISVWQGNNSTLPVAGPHQPGDLFAEFRSPHSGVDPELIQYLHAHRGNTRFLVATLNATSAAPLILETDQSVMALGGFLGTDPILTTQQLSIMVKNGTVRYFLLPSFSGNRIPPNILEILRERGISINELPPVIQERLRNGRRDSTTPFSENAAIVRWINKNCAVVPANAWQSASSTPAFPSNGGIEQQLYDCGGS